VRKVVVVCTCNYGRELFFTAQGRYVYAMGFTRRHMYCCKRCHGTWFKFYGGGIFKGTGFDSMRLVIYLDMVCLYSGKIGKTDT